MPSDLKTNLNTRRVATAVSTAVALGTSLAAPTAHAEFDLYSDDRTKLTFNFDAIVAGFASDDSWFGASKEFLGGPTNTWAEYGAEPRLTLESNLFGGTLFGQASAVYTRTGSDDASGLTIGEDAGEFTIEQGHLGWRVENLFGALENDTLSFSAGRQDFTLGTGMLINDGGADGGERGGWYLGMRKAFQESAIVSLESDELKLQAFRLENRPRDGGTKGKVFGVNAEYTFFGTTTVGLSYLQPDAQLDPPYDNSLDVYNGRLDWRPKGGLKGVQFSGEYAYEENDIIEAEGWFTEIGYEFGDAAWTPTLSYRYAFFEGDDPDTPQDEQFREIAYGFTDYGSWYQGEVTGNYPLANGNVISNRVRLKVAPNDSVTVNLMYYDFTLDQQQVFGDPVTSDDWGDEVDLTVDWAATDSIYVIGVLGYVTPGDAAEQWTGGDQDWLYSMLYLSYAY